MRESFVRSIHHTRISASTSILAPFFYVFIASYPLFRMFLFKGMFFVLTVGIMLVIVLDFLLRDGKLWFRKELIPPSLIYILPVISLGWTKYPSETLLGLLPVTLNLPLLYITMYAYCNGRGDIIRRCLGLLPIVLAISVALIWLKYGSVRPASVEMYESVGSFSNQASAMSVGCIPFLLWILKSGQGNRYFYGMALCFAIAVILLSQSRSGLVLMILSILMPLWLMSGNLVLRLARFFKWSIIFSIAVAVFISVCGFDNTVGPVFERIQSSQDISGYIGSPDKGRGDYGRAQMYATGIQMIKEYPMLGVGYRGFKSYMEENLGFGVVSHNIIITAWGELGLIGLIVYVGVFIREFMFTRLLLRVREPLLHDMAAASFTALLVYFIYALTRPFESILTLPIVFGIISTLRGNTRTKVVRESGYGKNSNN